MHIVIDTNVLISAALSPDGSPVKLLVKALTSHRLVFAGATFALLDPRLWEPMFDRYINLAARKAVLHDISAAAVWVEVGQGIANTTYRCDADDNMFIHAAIASGATLLVTGDQGLLVLADSLNGTHRLVVCKPADALSLI